MMRAFLVVALVLHATAASAQRPPALERVRVNEHVGERVPLELWFSNADGRRVQLRDALAGRPTLLVLTYVRCKMLCSLVLQGAIEVVRAMPLALGRDYGLVVVTIDPREELASSAVRARELRDRVGGEVTYLVGAQRTTARLADSLGFRYAWDSRTEQFAHPAVIFVLAPDGTIVRYLHGVRYEPAEVAAALQGEPNLAASLGEAVLACFRFDPAARAHREQIERYLRIAGAGVLAFALLGIGGLVLWERRRRRAP